LRASLIEDRPAWQVAADFWHLRSMRLLISHVC
jgi:hypothetical protein